MGYWYIVICIMALLLCTVIDFYDKVCNKNNNHCVTNKCPCIPRVEKRLQKFLECYFNEYWGSAYITTLIIFDALMIATAFNQRLRHMIYYPWLIIMAITLIGSIFLITMDYCYNGNKPTVSEVFVLIIAVHSLCYIYNWQSSNIEISFACR